MTASFQICFISPTSVSSEKASAESALMQSAFRHIEEETCIRFTKALHEKDYLFIVKRLGCYSETGRVGGRQEMSVGSGCFSMPIILHELMHAIGFRHEHTRPDRDRYIRILWENILPEMKSQFDKLPSEAQNLFDVTYDYRSILHYEPTTFSKNNLNTMEAREDGMTNLMGSSNELSEGDIRKINRLFKCHLKQRKKPYVKNDFRTNQLSLHSAAPQCRDNFDECPQFAAYCQLPKFQTLIRSYCPRTCMQCSSH
ncbi:hypothetical protein AB6A40_003566 [Gnathostoma spinigerum]|uniref:Metalloendopeptidase n=1 Tax=Gnathostoma spinigerum TaxID=75299 RepID=A0ABD6EC72_9BILA